MVAIKRLAGVTPGVNLGEHTLDMSLPSANKGAHSGFETQRRHHQKSKIGVSVVPLKDMCLQIFLKIYEY